MPRALVDGPAAAERGRAVRPRADPAGLAAARTAARADRGRRHLPGRRRLPWRPPAPRRRLRRAPPGRHPGPEPRLRPGARPPGPGARAQPLAGADAGPAQRGHPAGGGRARRTPARPAAAARDPGGRTGPGRRRRGGPHRHARTRAARPRTPRPSGPSTRPCGTRRIVYLEPNPTRTTWTTGSAGPPRCGVRARRAVRDMMLLSEASWRYGLRLALCIGLAQSLVSVIEVERSYWVALTVTFVLKPDFGSVFSRAVLRALGTAGGLVIAAAVLAEVPRGWWDVPVMMVLAALIPAFSVEGVRLPDRRDHPGDPAALGHAQPPGLRPDPAPAAGQPDRLRHRARRGLPAVARELAHPDRRPARRHRGRRRPLRGTGLRACRGRGRARGGADRPPPGPAAHLPGPVGRAQRVPAGADRTAADGHAGRGVVAAGGRRRADRGRDHRRAGPGQPRGARRPTADEVEGVVRQLRELAGRVRSSTTPVRVEAEPQGGSSGVLAPVHHELAAARAITQPDP